MKKFLKTTLVAALAALAVIACFAFGACGDGKDDDNTDSGNGGGSTTPSVLDKSLFVGEYGLYSLLGDTTDNDGNPITYTVGDSVPAKAAGNEEAMTLAADYQILKLNADGTFSWNSKYTMSKYQDIKNLSGTWETTKNGASISIANLNFVYAGTLKDGKLTLTYMDDVTVFSKK